jgi:hypothetical protein
METSPIATVSGICVSKEELSALCNELGSKLNDDPKVVIASYSSICDTSLITETLSADLPHSAIMGGSTCRGSLTQSGLVGFGEPNISLWALCDDDGDYGVGFAEYKECVKSATEHALEKALISADRQGELPDLVWIHSSPGFEEQVVSTLDQLMGGDVSIVGGSIADETLDAKWTCFAGLESTGNGIAVAVFFSSYDISTSFQCGYQPTTTQGVATRCEGRTVYEIDNQPAAVVYNGWANNLVDLSDRTVPVNVLGLSTLSPLGMAVGDVSGVPYYNLAHPESYTEDNALTFFCEVEEGETLTLMSGTLDNIIERPSRVANEAIHNVDSAEGKVLGGLVVFCGGCLLAIEPRVNEISNTLNASMEHQPFMGCFTFGEQGRFSGGENRHGNLMISVTVFRKLSQLSG